MRLVIAGGATGGHLFPGIALAEAMRERDRDAKITFMGADRGIETTIIPALGYDLITFPIGGIAGVGMARSLSRAATMILAVSRAVAMLRRLTPDLVVGVGGYASVPGVLAAAVWRIPRCILEQNVIPGKANRFLARFVPRIYLGFPTDRSVFPQEKTTVTGNPIRSQALTGEARVKAPGGGITLLILGGSQGASQLNDLALKTVPGLMRRIAGLKVIHQTGPAHEASVKQHYEREGVDVEVVPFIGNMGAYYARADLVLSRSGAMSVSELAASGLPAIFIPYPHATERHQRANGRWLESQGGAILMEAEEVTPEMLRDLIEHLLAAPNALSRMAEASRRAGTRNSARRIIEEEMRRLGVIREGEKAEEREEEGARGRGGEESDG
ncbi:MAG: undecaprenyldiphospho-muramoylpentapeptide beta-N-acetylglucosaminyltransferase [bacterium]|nr:MAG: undecaprenyldiphospho-muramoylpentapeptide beta-N-acetylglucosaminyltransferase [bacterium]